MQKPSVKNTTCAYERIPTGRWTPHDPPSRLLRWLATNLNRSSAWLSQTCGFPLPNRFRLLRQRTLTIFYSHAVLVFRMDWFVPSNLCVFLVMRWKNFARSMFRGQGREEKVRLQSQKFTRPDPPIFRYYQLKWSYPESRLVLHCYDQNLDSNVNRVQPKS